MAGKSFFIFRSHQKQARISRQYEDCEPVCQVSVFVWNTQSLPHHFRAASVCAPTDCRELLGTAVGAIFILPARPQQCGGLRDTEARH